MKLLQFLSILFIGLCYSQSAAAYLDPGTGSLILQMLIAGIIGAMFTIKLYWYRLMDFVDRIFGKSTESESDSDNDGAPD
ncbi:MAG: hypothetical protein ACI9XC_000459 [Gammaproteobacteria bacterium]|jgi:hypothetical protein